MIHGRHVREEQINSRQRTELAIRWQQPAQPQFVTPERHLDGRSYGVHCWVVKRGANLHTQLAPPQATTPPTPSFTSPDLPLVGEGGYTASPPVHAADISQHPERQVMVKIRLLGKQRHRPERVRVPLSTERAAPRPGDGPPFWLSPRS